MKTATILCSVICLAIATQNAGAQTAHSAAPHSLVYKTRKDYSKLVPVVLSDDKTKIVSYSDPHDIKAGGIRLLPTALHKGYLLDNRGISANTAFLSMTWTKYASLPSAPSATELYAMIKDKDPITFLCDCGKKSAAKHTAAEINKLIDQRRLSKSCTTIKGGK